jgi:hypothetical protein
MINMTEDKDLYCGCGTKSTAEDFAERFMKEIAKEGKCALFTLAVSMALDNLIKRQITMAQKVNPDIGINLIIGVVATTELMGYHNDDFSEVTERDKRLGNELVEINIAAQAPENRAKPN